MLSAINITTTKIEVSWPEQVVRSKQASFRYCFRLFAKSDMLFARSRHAFVETHIIVCTQQYGVSRANAEHSGGLETSIYPDLFTPNLKQVDMTTTERTAKDPSKIVIMSGSLMKRPQRFRVRGLYMTSSRTPRKTYAPVYNVSSIDVPSRSHAPVFGQNPSRSRNTATQDMMVPAQPNRVASPGDLRRDIFRR